VFRFDSNCDECRGVESADQLESLAGNSGDFAVEGYGSFRTFADVRSVLRRITGPSPEADIALWRIGHGGTIRRVRNLVGERVNAGIQAASAFS